MQLTPEQEAALREYLVADKRCEQTRAEASAARQIHEHAKIQTIEAANNLRAQLGIAGQQGAQGTARIVLGEDIYTVNHNGVFHETAYIV